MARCASLVTALLPFLLAPGCPFSPPGSPDPGSAAPDYCSEADLQDLRYEDSVLAGDAGQIVFERIAYPTSGCIPPGYTCDPCSTSVGEPPMVVLYPAEHTLVTVQVPSLMRTASIYTPPVAMYRVASDARWAVLFGDSLRWHDLDTGDERILLDNVSVYEAPAVAKPFVLLSDMLDHDQGSTLLNVETGDARSLPRVWGDYGLSARLLAYVDAADRGSATRHLRVLDLDANTDTVIRETADIIEGVHALRTRVIWVEYNPHDGVLTVRDYDADSGQTGVLYQIAQQTPDPISTYATNFIADVDEAGILVGHAQTNLQAGIDTVTYQLVAYDGTATTIDTRGKRNGTGPRPGLAGPYVVYPQDGAWIIYDPVQGSTLQVTPFAP